MRMLYVANARLPHKKAYGIQIAKMCEAFIEAGVKLTLIVPGMGGERSLKDFYGLRAEVPVVRISVPDWYAKGPIMFFLASCVFMLKSFFTIRRMQADLVYTVDMDTFSFTLLSFAGKPCVAEMHEGKPKNWLTSSFFSHAKKIIATNAEIRDSLIQTFGLPKERFLVEPNGVDLRQFENLPSLNEARAKLGLAIDKRIALYAGRFYAWKGLEILAAAAERVPEIDIVAVGGSEEEFKNASGVSSIPPNLRVMGEVSNSEVPMWLTAADTLLVLGTQKNERSYRHTSPMKVFEYMAAERPVIAAATPAITSIIPDGIVTFYTPDDATDLARKISTPTENTGAARALAAQHSWKNRAQRIVETL